jgi:hypothetical protein
LGILGFSFFFFLKKKEGNWKKKKKKKEKIEEEIGVAGHPIPAVWGWLKPPQAFEGGPATPKGQKKKRKNGFGILGVGWPATPISSFFFFFSISFF